MKEKIVKQLHHLIEERNNRFVTMTRIDKEHTLEERKWMMHRNRGAEIVRSSVEGDVIRSLQYNHHQLIDYGQRYEQLIRLKGSTYLEEYVEFRRAIFEKGQLIGDNVIIPYQEEKTIEPVIEDGFSISSRQNKTFSAYDRREAVRYAERWWNDYNPTYKKFTDNCTNFISQCLRAGGGAMTGHPNRSKGWWYQSNNWSFSWSVAHSLRWYLSGAKTGLRGREMQSAKELEPGDVICYDFDGNGRWQHSTIVVTKDAHGEPLVNAQTSNSRMRYWAYEDSTAWTPNIQYLFFHIIV